MVLKYFLLLIFLTTTLCAKAQITDTVMLNRMGDFDMATLNGDSYGALSLGERILADTGKLDQKVRVNFFSKLAKAYDEADQDDKAIFYYEKVAAAAPNYFVAQRALGYLYNEIAEDIQLKLYITPQSDPAYKPLSDRYENAVHKSLPHLEKAQACDPDDDTLDLIKTLYNNINDNGGFLTFKQRMPDLSKSCVDLLEDKQ